MKTRILSFTGRLFLVALFAISFSCQDDLIKENVSPDHNNTAASQESADEMIILGEQLENPYATKVMKQAAINIGARVNIETTHLYVKFIPKNEEDLDRLNVDSTLTLFSYPLDRELSGGGVYYRDPNVPEGQPTYSVHGSTR